MKEFKRKSTILINRVLIGTCSESFEFIAFCIGFIGIAFLVAKFVFVRYAIEYFDCMLIICPVAYYFTYRYKTEKKIKNEKMRRELLEENEKLRSQDEKNRGES